MEENANMSTPMSELTYSTGTSIIIIIIFGLMCIGTALGNFLVIFAVAIVKKLQSPSNLLIVSLACSDLLVALLVVPLNVDLELHNAQWRYGAVFCDIYISFDVLLCTASIMNLCTISVDRYLVITRPMSYSVKRTPGRMGLMIAGAWLLAALVTIPPLLITKDKSTSPDRLVCEYSNNFIYQIYACVCAFYIPLIVMLVLYGRIFILARAMHRADARQQSKTTLLEVEQPLVSDIDKSRKSSVLCNRSPQTNNLIGTSSVGFNQEFYMQPQPKFTLINSDNNDKLVRIPLYQRPISNRCPCKMPFYMLKDMEKAPSLDLIDSLSHSVNNNHLPNRRSSQMLKSLKSLTPKNKYGGFRLSFTPSVALNITTNNSATNSTFNSRKTSFVERVSHQLLNKDNGPSSKNKQDILVAQQIVGKSSGHQAKAVKTLGFIMGCFTICWLPFFTIQLTRFTFKAFDIELQEYPIYGTLFKLFNWLGMANSLLNPVIYAKFNRDFRKPFREILLCHCRNINLNLRSDMPKVHTDPLLAKSASFSLPSKMHVKSKSDFTPIAN